MLYQFTPVPEPVTVLGLVATGIAVAGLLKRKKPPAPVPPACLNPSMILCSYCEKRAAAALAMRLCGHLLHSVRILR